MRVAIIIGCLMLVACSEPLHHGLDEASANDVVATLRLEGIAADKVSEGRDGFRVDVPTAALARSVEVLNQHGLPRAAPASFEDTYPQGGLVNTAREERALWEHARAQELRAALQSIAGVQQAHVHLVVPSKTPFADAAIAARASVVLRVEPAPAVAIANVQAIVAGAVPELQPADVTVVVSTVAPPERKELELATVGPILVAAESQTIARVFFGSPFIITLLLGIWLALPGRLRKGRTEA